MLILKEKWLVEDFYFFSDISFLIVSTIFDCYVIQEVNERSCHY